MIDIVFGKKGNPQAVDALIETISGQDWEGTLYIGYPVFSNDDGVAATDALLTTKEHGVVIFDLAPLAGDQKTIEEIAETLEIRQNDLYRGLHSRLFSYRELTKNKGRDLALDINTITLLPDRVPGLDDHLEYSIPQSLIGDLGKLNAISSEVYTQLNAAIQKTAALKPKKKRIAVKREDSMGGVIKKIEFQVANLDRWQKAAAIECPEGPQRVRGLAGSGKTIILAMKAAYLHANFPDQDIIVTFQTRALYQQFQSLIDKFYYDQMRDYPDWNRLKILHAWGSSSSAGVYSEIAKHTGAAALSFGEARNKYGYSKAFQGACDALLSHVNEKNFEPLWDFILVDEAQDFPAEFFRLAHKMVRQPKRIVWAYDELQNLGDYAMPPVAELFGVDNANRPLVVIENKPGLPKQDILLPVCYRNPSWVLSLALGLGLGIYREDGPVQMFDEPNIWLDIGYEKVSGDLELGKSVVLARRADRSPQFFGDLLEQQESVQFKRFDDLEQQSEWIAEQIQNSVTIQELDLNDILIVVPDAMYTAKIADPIRRALRKRDIPSHIVGVTSSRDWMFDEGSVAISGIYRAKGNEAPLVFIASADYCFSGSELAKRRNVLFTAITRSKAWVRICGVGSHMDGLISEIEKISGKQYQLDFKYPTEEEIQNLRRTYREKTEAEKLAERKQVGQIRDLLNRLDSGEIDFDLLPDDLASRLKYLREE
jgi:superfamily I DNA and RNA helicase